jgi:hypothetical protein
MSSTSTLASFQMLQRLRNFVDSRLGVPPTSQRPAPVGPVLVGVRRGFRRAFQPLINEVLDRQTRFNEEVLDWGRALTRDIESLERSFVSMSTSIDLRLTRLEAIATRLETLRASEKSQAAEPKSAGRSKSTNDKV